MKTKNIVIVTNLYNPDKAMVVKDFRDENIKQALGKLMDIKPNDLRCVSASMSSGIYEVTKKYRALKDEVKKIEGLRLNSDKEVLLQVSYATLYE